MTTKSDTLHYLLGLGFLSPKQVHDSDIRIDELSSRNRAMAARISDGRSLFIKLPSGATDDAIQTLQNEASFLSLVADPAMHSLQRFIPRLYRYDAARCLLITEFVDGAQTLHELLSSRSQIPSAVSADLGEALAYTHFGPFTPELAEKTNALPITPWALLLHSPEKCPFVCATQGDQMILSQLRSMPEACVAMQRLLEQYEPSTVIHNDAKAANVLIAPGVGKLRLVLTDWELRTHGDPIWDIGSMLGSCFIASFAWSGPNTTSAGTSFCHQLWASYVHHAAILGHHVAHKATKTGTMAAIRMIQFCLESTKAVGVADQTTLQLFRYATSLLVQPSMATAQLCGVRA